MLLRKRKNAVVLALILLSSLITLSLFQNCSGGIHSQADLSSLSSDSADNSSNATPTPAPAPTPTPNPVPLPTGCSTMQPPNEETMTSACPSGKVGTGIFAVYSYTCVGTSWVRNATPTTVTRCADPTAIPLSNNDILKLCRPFVQNTQVAKATSTLYSFSMMSGLGDGTLNNIGNGDTASQQATATIDPKILAGSQNLNTLSIDGQARDQATYSCKFITNVTCSVLASSSTVSKAINMDPTSPNYGKDEVALANAMTDPVKKQAALDAITQKILALGNGTGTPTNSCTFQMTNPLAQTSRNYFMTHNKRDTGYRCVQASLKIRVGVRTQVDVETTDSFKTLMPSAATDFSVLDVAVNDNCWAEANLIPNPAALPTTANYGAAVAASSKWLVVLSPSDNLFDGAGNISQALVGSLSIFDRTNPSASPQKIYLPGIVGGGSQGDSTVAASIYGDSLAVSRVNRSTGKGYVYFFANTSGVWSQKGPTLQQPTGQDKQRFGHALALSSSGLLAVGAPYFAQNGVVTTAYGDLSGRVYIYYCPSTGCSYLGEIQNSTTPNSVFGSSVSISGNRVAVGAPYLAAVTDDRGEGYVSVYDITPSPYSYVGVKTLSPPGTANPAGYGRAFGASVAINGNKLVVGAPNRGTQAATITEKIGEAYFYSNVATTVTPVIITGTAAGNLLGQGVALNNKEAFIGCPYCQNNMGRVSVHSFDGTGNIAAAPDRYIFPLDRINRDGFGNAVFATDIDLVVGASNRTVGSTQAAGAAYRYLVP